MSAAIVWILAFGIVVLAGGVVNLPSTSPQSTAESSPVTVPPSASVAATPAQRPSPSVSSATPMMAPSTSATSTSTPAVRVYLTDVQPSSSQLSEGTWRVDDTTYAHSLGYQVDYYTVRQSAVYRLDSKYLRFTADLAMTDKYQDAQLQGRLVVALDDRPVIERRVTVGHPVKLDIDISGVRQMTLTVDATDVGSPLIVIGEATLYG